MARRGYAVSIRIDDLCSGAGLGADGYATVFGGDALHGYDIADQPDYPYTFTQADVFDVLATDTGADARHTSFPCQAHTDGRHLRTAQGGSSRFEDLLTPGLEILRRRWNGQPWVVENVDDRSGNVRRIMAPREGESLIVLCGTMFGLPIWRHRLFLANFDLRPFPAVPGGGKYRAQGCRHDTCEPDPVTGRPRPWGVYHVAGDSIPEGGRTCRDEEHARQVMGVNRSLPWESLKEGFPPAYTAYVGLALFVELYGRGYSIPDLAAAS